MTDFNKKTGIDNFLLTSSEESCKKETTIVFTTTKRIKGKWTVQARKKNIPLSTWIIEKLNTDIEFDIQEVKLYNEIPESQRYFIKINVPMAYKNYWVISANRKRTKLRIWIINKLNVGIDT